MNKKFTIFIITAALLLAGAVIYNNSLTPKQLNAIPRKTPHTPPPESVPDFSFTTMEGKEFRLSAIEHEEILVHFWAGWCAVCFEEFPRLLEYVKKQNGKTALLAIAIDDTLPPIQKFMNKLESLHDITLDRDNVYWIWDSDKSISLKTFNTVRVPETITVDAQRLMVKKTVGAGEW